MSVFWAFLSNLPGGIYDWILQTLSGFHCASTSHSWRGTPNNFLVPKKFFVWALIGFQKSLFQREMANADGTTSSCVTFSHPHHFHSHILSSLLMMFRLCIQGYVPGSNAYSYSGHSWYWCFINHFLLHFFIVSNPHWARDPSMSRILRIFWILSCPAVHAPYLLCRALKEKIFWAVGRFLVYALIGFIKSYW